jgi:hypothetical protein
VVEKYLKNLLGEDTLALHMVEKTDKYKALITEKDKLVYKVRYHHTLSHNIILPSHSLPSYPPLIYVCVDCSRWRLPVRSWPTVACDLPTRQASSG